MTAPAPTLLTPTARLARNLARELAADMTARGQAAWLAPRIYSIPAWLSRIRDDYFLNSDDHRVPISAEQALLLWQSLIDVEVFVGEPSYEMRSGVVYVFEHDADGNWVQSQRLEPSSGEAGNRFGIRLYRGNHVHVEAQVDTDLSKCICVSGAITSEPMVVPNY